MDHGIEDMITIMSPITGSMKSIATRPIDDMKEDINIASMNSSF